MRFTKVDKMPAFKRGYGARQLELMEFMKMEVMCVKVALAPNEYSTINTARTTLQASAKKAGLPIKVRILDRELYLIRTDM